MKLVMVLIFVVFLGWEVQNLERKQDILIRERMLRK